VEAQANKGDSNSVIYDDEEGRFSRFRVGGSMADLDHQGFMLYKEILFDNQYFMYPVFLRSNNWKTSLVDPANCFCKESNIIGSRQFVGE
jgi:hypothetical protein